MAGFERLGLPYMVTGSTASILYGEPRMTHDVDVVLAFEPRDAEAIESQFPLDTFYCPPADILAIEARRDHGGHFNLIHRLTGFKADVYAAWDELHRWALPRRHIIHLADAPVAVAPREYVILRKLEYFREGRSQKHVRDIRSMLETSGADIDTVFLREQIAKRGLAAAWADVQR